MLKVDWSLYWFTVGFVIWQPSRRPRSKSEKTEKLNAR